MQVNIGLHSKGYEERLLAQRRAAGDHAATLICYFALAEKSTAPMAACKLCMQLDCHLPLCTREASSTLASPFFGDSPKTATIVASVDEA